MKAGAKCLELIKTTFDGTENEISAAVSCEIIGIFADDEDKTAFSKIAEWFRQNHPITLYLGYDEKVYPRFEVKSRVIQ